MCFIGAERQNHVSVALKLHGVGSNIEHLVYAHNECINVSMLITLRIYHGFSYIR